MTTKQIMTAKISAYFGCTEEQVKTLYLKNSHELRGMALKAEAKNKRVNGYTSSELHHFADHAKSCAS